MKVTFDLPDSTKAAFLDFVYENEKGFSMEVTSAGTSDLYDGCIIVCRTNREAEYEQTD